MGNDFVKKELFRVEKFIPSFCPKCETKFGQQDKDFAIILGNIETDSLGQEKKKAADYAGYDVIICQHCRNFTSRILLETRLVDTIAEVQLLVEEEGFANIHQVIFEGEEKQLERGRQIIFWEQVGEIERFVPFTDEDSDELDIGEAEADF